MPTRPLSLRTSLGIAIVLMGTLGMVLALVTGEIYHRLAMDQQRDSLAELLRIETRYQLDRLEKQAGQLGLSLQHTEGFRTAMEARDWGAMSTVLDNQFRQYFVTADVIDLKKIYLFDRSFALLSESTERVGPTEDGRLLCPDLVAQARKRRGSERLRAFTGVCTAEGLPYYAVIVPVGGLVPKSYLMVVTDPSRNLLPAERKLNMPLQIVSSNQRVLYESVHWPHGDVRDNALLMAYPLKAADGKTVLTLRMVSDTKVLGEELTATRLLVMLIAGGATALTVLLAFLGLRKTVLAPLDAMTRQVRRIRNDRAHLGEQVSVRGNREIARLAQDFNAMSRELKELYQTLEHMAFTDPLTKLSNRAWFHDILAKFITISQRQNTPFALFVMDLDRFKAVNDNFGHHVGDAVLQQVAQRLVGVLRSADVLARIGGERAWAGEGTVARVGGDEFAAILPAVRSQEDAATVARKLLKAMEPPIMVDGRPFDVGMSIGIALYPRHGTEGDQMVRHADAAMYEAKEQGKGYCFCEQGCKQLSIRWESG